MYLDHFQNNLYYSRGLLIFLFLTPLWLSETDEIWGFRAFHGEPIREMAWTFARCFILITFKTIYFTVTVCWFVKILPLFWLGETGLIWGLWPFWSCSADFPHYAAPLAETGFLGIIWTTCGCKFRGGRHISVALRRVLYSSFGISSSSLQHCCRGDLLWLYAIVMMAGKKWTLTCVFAVHLPQPHSNHFV